ncbi:MAG: glycosyltransferase family 4 protein [Bacteroidota bacterium]
MKILQLCHKIPFPLHDGGAVSLYYTALGLVYQGVELKVLAIDTPKSPVDINGIPSGFREKTGFECAAADTRVDLFGAMVNLFSNQSYFVERFFSTEYRDALTSVLKNEDFDIVQLEHLYLGLYLETIRKHSRARIVLRPQNVENQVWRSYLDRTVNPLKKLYLQMAVSRLENFERQVSEKVDGIIAISGNDAGTFSRYALSTPCITVPIGYDFGTLSAFSFDNQYDHFPVFYHLGSMDWLPNVQGIKWFIEKVMPRVLEDYPGFRFRVGGKKMPGWFFRHQDRHLIVDGEVPDALLYHRDKSVMIVPLLSGGGLRAKIVEAMMLGKTVISTSTGAAGIPCRDQENILIADTPEEFVNQIIKCRDSEALCRKIGSSARLLATEHYDCRKTARQMIRFYRELMVV